MYSKTLLTGVPGWLGSRLAEVLATDVNNLGNSSKYPNRQINCLVLPGSDIEDIKGLPVELIQGDIRKLDSLAAAVEGVDTVIHAAGIIHPKQFSDFYEINTRGTRNLLNAAVKAKVRRFIYISANSAAGHQKNRQTLMSENDLEHPHMHYGRSKLLAEKEVQSYFDAGYLETVILRPFWFYGPGQPARQTTFFRMIHKGNPWLFGDGNNLRSMTYIDSLIQAILLAETSSAAAGQVFFIADKNPYTTLEIYNTVAEHLGIQLHPRHLPALLSQVCELADNAIQTLRQYSMYMHVAGEMTKNIGCVPEKAERILGYDARISLHEGMRRSVEWCNANGIQL